LGLIAVQGRQSETLGNGNSCGWKKSKITPRKLLMIFRFTDELIVKWKPDEVAAEAPFFGKECAVDAQTG
jgi:Holliday junction resolvasome RuvABC endonuclease subunit